MTKKDIKTCISKHDYKGEVSPEGWIMTFQPEECHICLYFHECADMFHEQFIKSKKNMRDDNE